MKQKLVIVIFVLLAMILAGCNAKTVNKDAQISKKTTYSSTAGNKKMPKKEVTQTKLSSSVCETKPVKKTAVSASKKRKNILSKQEKSKSSHTSICTADKVKPKRKFTPNKTKTSKKAKHKKAKTEKPTKAVHKCQGNKHAVKCGNMGRWFSSKAEVKAYADSVMKSWANKWESGEISDDEYFSGCPQGYECWSCGYCGKWTGSFK